MGFRVRSFLKSGLRSSASSVGHVRRGELSGRYNTPPPSSTLNLKSEA